MTPTAPSEEFDPALVPVFPVLTVQVTADGGALLNGRALPVGPDEDPTDVALEAAAAEARLLPGDCGAIRVRGVTADGTVFPLVVRADGSVHELPVAPQRTARPAWLLPAVAAGTVVVLAGGALGLTTLLRPAPVPTAAPITAAPPGAGANLPVHAPPGYAQRATWAVPISERVTPTSTTTGDLAVVTAAGDLVLLDDQTGRTLWTGRDAPRAGELHLLRSGDVDVIAAASGTTLQMWPIEEGPAKTRPFSIEVPRDGEVTFEGSAPLITLPDQTAGLLDRGELTLLDVPVGANAVAADSDSIIAVDLTGTWYDVAPGEDPVAHRLPRPDGAQDSAVRVIGAGGRHIVLVWTVGDDQVVTLHDLVTGADVAQANVGRVDLIRAEVLHQPVQEQMMLGTVLIDYSSTPAVVPLMAGLTPEVLTDGHVYGDLDGDRIDAVIDGTQVTAQPATGASAPAADEAFPVATSNTHAYVAAHKRDAFLLHALPTSGGTR